MMCFVPGCKHYSEKNICRFFTFTKDPKERSLWIKLIRRADRDPNNCSRICSCHFKDALKKNGPTIFEHDVTTRLGFSSHTGEKRTKFPKSRQSVHKAWLEAVSQKNFKPCRSAVICSEHFTDSDFVESEFDITNRRFLKSDAIPSLNLILVENETMSSEQTSSTAVNPKQNVCCVKGCASVKENLNVYFVRFPTSQNLKSAWLTPLGFDDKKRLPKTPLICSEHFEEKDFLIKPSGLRILKKEAIPLSFHSNVQEETSCSRRRSGNDNSETGPSTKRKSPSEKAKIVLESSSSDTVTVSDKSETLTASSQEGTLTASEISHKLSEISSEGGSDKRFPKRKEMCEKWVKAVNDETLKPDISTYICTAHFLESDFNYSTFVNRKFLRTDAVPSVFNNKQKNIASAHNTINDPDEQVYNNRLLDIQTPVQLLLPKVTKTATAPIYTMTVPASIIPQRLILPKVTIPTATPLHTIPVAVSNVPQPIIPGNKIKVEAEDIDIKKEVIEDIPEIKKEVIEDDITIKEERIDYNFDDAASHQIYIKSEIIMPDIKEEIFDPSEIDSLHTEVTIKSEPDHNYAKRSEVHCQTEAYVSELFSDPRLLILRQKLKKLQHLLYVKHSEYMKRKRYIKLMTSPRAMQKRIEYLKNCMKLKAIKNKKRKQFILNRAIHYHK